MHLKIMVCIGVILFGMVSIGQSLRADMNDDDDDNEMSFEARDLVRAARRQERYEALAERLNFRRRGTGDKYCVEIRQDINTFGMQAISEYWGVTRDTVQACMADCNKVANCIQWTYHNDPNDQVHYKKCYLKSTKGTERTVSGVISGSCDNTQSYILGVGTDGTLWTRATLDSNWVQVPNTHGQVSGVAVLKDGKILGIGGDGKLWTRDTLNSNWVQVPNTHGVVTAIAQLNDGTILGVGTDAKLWTRATLDSNWIQVPNTHGEVSAITQLSDGAILGVGGGGKLWTRATLDSNWVQVPNTHGVVTGIAQLSNGAILGIGTDQKLWTRDTLESNWVQVPNTHGLVIAIATTSH